MDGQHERVGLSDLGVVRYALEEMEACMATGDLDEALGHLDVAQRSLRDLEATLREHA